MNHHLKVADQALEKAKEEMLVLLKKYGEDLKEVLARSKASALLEQMVDEIHLKEKEQIKEKQRESDWVITTFIDIFYRTETRQTMGNKSSSLLSDTSDRFAKNTTEHSSE